MKILHTADWHLGKKLDNYSRLPEQKEVLEEICEIAEREAVDVVLIAGDLYDTFTPPTEAVTLFYKTVKKLAKDGKRPVIAIAGNHDSPDRIEAPEPLALECGIFLLGFPYSTVPVMTLDSGVAVTRSEKGFIEIKLPQHSTPLRLILTPYANELRLKKYLGTEDREEELRNVLEKKWAELADTYCDTEGINMLVAHLFMAKQGEEHLLEEDLEEEKSILHIGGAQAIYSRQVPAQMQYVALGHLHRRQTVDKEPCPVVYSSSPIAYSFAESNQDKYVVIVEAEASQPVSYTPVRLQKGKRLLQARFQSVDEAAEWLQQHPDALVEITVVTDHYLTSQERRRLNNLHSGIKAIIPDIRIQNGSDHTTSSIDITKGKVELFKDYFKYKNNNQEPNQRLMDLFKEILSK